MKTPIEILLVFALVVYIISLGNDLEDKESSNYIIEIPMDSTSYTISKNASDEHKHAFFLRYEDGAYYNLPYNLNELEAGVEYDYLEFIRGEYGSEWLQLWNQHVWITYYHCGCN